MKISQLVELRGEIGGKGFLDPKLYLVIALATAPLGGLFGRNFTTVDEFFKYLLAILASIAITALPFFAIRIIKEKLNLHFSTTAVVLTGAFLGFTKSLSTAYIVASLELEELEGAIQSRLTSGVMIGIVIILLFSALPVVVNRFENQRLALVRSSVATELAITVNPVLAKAKVKFDELRDASKQANDVADQLIQYSNEVLRPKLLELWGQKAKAYPSLEPFEILRYSFRHTDIPLLPYVLVIGLGTMFRTNYQELGFLAFLAFITNLVAISLGIMAANWVKQRGLPWIALLVATAVTGTSLTALNQFGNPTTDITVTLINLSLASLFAMLHTQITTVLAAGLTAITNQEKDQAKFELSLANSSPNEVARMLAARRAAEILHGQVQSWILASAIRMRQNPDLASNELSTLRNQIDSSLDDLADVETSEFEKSLKQIWGGVIDIQFKVFGSVSRFDLASQEAIREAITNARKHGAATWVSIEVEGDISIRRISVRDNGSRVVGKSRGIGSALLTSLGYWKLSPNELGGTTLELTFRTKA